MDFRDERSEMLHRAFLGEHSEDMIDFLYALNTHQAMAEEASAATALAREFGWVDGSGTGLTTEGWMVSDSCREYRFWQGRDRKLPFEGASDRLDVEEFRNRAVLEIGSGMGANLLSLAGVAQRVAGVEPGEIYVRCGSVFSEREGLPLPETKVGSAERIPFPDASFDIVLCVSAHYFFDMHVAFREIRRVLRPGGELIIIGGHFRKHLGEVTRASLRNPLALRGGMAIILNTLSYTCFGSRILRPHGAFTTSRPIYPTVASLCRWIERSGFCVREKGSRIGDERLFRATLPELP